MIILDVEQGSEAWLDARWARRCASEAPVIMGASRFMSRQELVRIKALGGQKEFSDYVRKKLLEKGHEAEGMARSLEEVMIGEELFPITGTDDSGKWLASFDGVNMLASVAWEHKLWNDAIADQISCGEIEPEYYWQLEHQARVAGLKTVRFACSDGTPERYLAFDYISREERQKQLEAGWIQFEEDVANYQHVEVLPKPTGAPVVALPELEVIVVGEVRSSNLATWSDVVLRRIQDIKEDLQTDQDFADAEKMVKFLEHVEKKLEIAEARVLSQTGSIDEVVKTVRHLKEQTRSKRLTLSKLATTRKETIRAEVIQAGRDAFGRHVASLNARLGRPYMPQVLTDFAGAVRGKKTKQSALDAVDSELARAKLAANDIADRIQMNLTTFAKAAKGNEHQFPDLQELVQKAPEDFEAFIAKRIADNKAAEERRRHAEEVERFERGSPVAQVSTSPGIRDSKVPPALPEPAASSPMAAWTLREQVIDVLGRIVLLWRTQFEGDDMDALIEEAEALLAVERPRTPA